MLTHRRFSVLLSLLAATASPEAVTAILFASERHRVELQLPTAASSWSHLIAQLPVTWDDWPAVQGSAHSQAFDRDGAKMQELASLQDRQPVLLHADPQIVATPEGGLENPKFLQQLLADKGYALLRGAVSWDEAQTVLNAVSNMSSRPFKRRDDEAFGISGFQLQGVAQDARLASLQPILMHERLLQWTAAAAGSADVGFANHSDIRINMVSGWHRDRLGEEVRQFETLTPWELDPSTGRPMFIYKFLLYLNSEMIRNPTECSTPTLMLIPTSHQSEGRVITLLKRGGFEDHRLMAGATPCCNKHTGCDLSTLHVTYSSSIDLACLELVTACVARDLKPANVLLMSEQTVRRTSAPSFSPGMNVMNRRGSCKRWK